MSDLDLICEELDQQRRGFNIPCWLGYDLDLFLVTALKSGDLNPVETREAEYLRKELGDIIG